jgi:hypothetical protein
MRFCGRIESILDRHNVTDGAILAEIAICRLERRKTDEDCKPARGSWCNDAASSCERPQT